jgi:hypothetical protein
MAHTHTCAHTRTHTHTHTYSHTHTCCTCSNNGTHIHAHTLVHTHHTYTLVHTHIYTHTLSHTRTHTHNHSHTHTHTCCSCSSNDCLLSTQVTSRSSSCIAVGRGRVAAIIRVGRRTGDADTIVVTTETGCTVCIQRGVSLGLQTGPRVRVVQLQVWRRIIVCEYCVCLHLSACECVFVRVCM